MFAVVLKSECPNQSWICFRGTPLASNRLAQLWRRSWKRTFFHSVPLNKSGKLCGQIVGFQKISHFIHKYKAVVFVVVAVAADLLVQFLRRLDLRKIFL